MSLLALDPGAAPPMAAEPPLIEELLAGADRPPLAVLKCNNALNSLSNEQCFWVVGTAHVSAASCDDVRKVVRAVQPEVVVLELCSERRPLLHMDRLKVPSLHDALAQWRRGSAGAFEIIYSWYLGQVAAAMEVLPGEEFRVACDEAHCLGAKVVLGDRPLHVTLARLWASLSLWDKARLLAQLLWQGLKLPDKDELAQLLEEMKETDAVTAAIEELGESFPPLRAALISERDQFLTYVLRRLSERATRVVAVVGAGHLPGIRAHWEQEIDVQELMRLPEKRRASRWPLLAAASVAAGSVVLVLCAVRWRR